MQCHIILPLAVCSYIVKAGPLRHRAAYPLHNNLPRFVNETAIPSPTTSRTSTSTSSTVSIPFSNDASFSSTPLSRVSTSQDGEQESQSKQKNAEQHGAEGVAIDLEADNAATAILSTAASTPETTTSISPSQVSVVASFASSASSTSSMSASFAATVITDDITAGSRKAEQNQESQAPASASFSATGQFIEQPSMVQSPAIQIPETQVAVSAPRLPPPFTNVESGRSQVTNTPTAKPTPSVVGQFFDQVQDAQNPGTQAMETRATTTGLSTVSQALNQIENSRFAAAGSIAVSDTVSGQLNEQSTNTARVTTISSAPPSQVTEQMSNARLPMSSSAPSMLPSIIQVPSELLGGASTPTSGSSVTSLSQSNKVSAPKYPYPNADGDNVAMATGYNDVFQRLNPTSKCDPNNAKHASACVDGQPAKCEVDGTYTLQSCDQGKSCYAMPLPDGRIGINIECQEPKVYQKAVSSGRAAASSRTSNTKIAATAATASAIASSQQVGGAAVASSVANNKPTSPTIPTEAESLAQADTVPSGAAVPSENIPNADSTFAGFSAPASTSHNIQQTLASPTPTTITLNTQTKQPGPHQQGAQRDEDQQTSSSISPSSLPKGGSGVILNFLGADDPAADSHREQQVQSKKNAATTPDIPPTEQKDKVFPSSLREPQAPAAPSAQEVKPVAALADTVPSSTPLSPVSPTRSAKIPGLTIAPVADDHNPSGPVTVTVTYTTTCTIPIEIMHSHVTLALSLLLSSSANAWGTLGHATIAEIASNYLTAEAKTWVSSILGSGVTMPSVASWADNFRYTTAGRYSAPYHFVDAEDLPPSSCSVDLSRDCGSGGCIVSAIANYTQRVQDGRLSAVHQKEALEFLIHFLGDITQPLHVEAEEVGGNNIKVTWEGKDTNLHSCWDTQMVEKAAGGGNSTGTLASFSETLIARTDSGSYSSQKASWVSCTDIRTAGDCALAWARDANAFICQYVLKTDESGMELDGDYYAGAEPIIELQIAKAGYRLGAWLNALAAAA
ncbi:MAG: hypothetical protein Q9217_000758 [Psora testacea]